MKAVLIAFACALWITVAEEQVLSLTPQVLLWLCSPSLRSYTRDRAWIGGKDSSQNTERFSFSFNSYKYRFDDARGLAETSLTKTTFALCLLCWDSPSSLSNTSTPCPPLRVLIWVFLFHTGSCLNRGWIKLPMFSLRAFLLHTLKMGVNFFNASRFSRMPVKVLFLSVFQHLRPGKSLFAGHTCRSQELISSTAKRTRSSIASLSLPAALGLYRLYLSMPAGLHTRARSSQQASPLTHSFTTLTGVTPHGVVSPHTPWVATDISPGK